ncbi:hypothetical protein ACLI1A_18285 [Flavobacterium sp. RHBU_3]|uniref:hypothetical protein n=1 Tax=Flavobacterium sp. RHBU_3 TaxID=3391184 RepID=UPI0039856295
MSELVNATPQKGSTYLKLNILVPIPLLQESKNSPEDISIGFMTSAGASFKITSDDGTIIKELFDASGVTNWYKLSSFSKFKVFNFSGRVYFCYDKTFSGPNEPAQNITQQSFYYRYDKFEMTFNGNPADSADTTSIDYWSIPITLNGLKGGKQTKHPKSHKKNSVNAFINGATAQKIYEKLNAITSPTPPFHISGAIPALVPGPYNVTPPKHTRFCRVIGPSSFPTFCPGNPGIPVMPYNIMLNYLESLYKIFKNKEFARLKGNFAGVCINNDPPPPYGPLAAQIYDASVTFLNDPSASYHNQNGKFVMEVSGKGNKLNSRGGAEDTFSMQFKIDDLLNPSGIYGASAAFTLKYFREGSSKATIITESPQNDLFGWITGDLLGGFNIGAIGSTVKVDNKEVGTLPSSEWYNIPQSNMFSNLQPNNPFYNQYAEVLSKTTEAYNFPYTDRIKDSGVLVSLNPSLVEELEVILEDSTVHL